MIKKYFVDSHSDFNKSIILSLFEPGKYSFHIEGLTDKDNKDLFPHNKIRIVKNEIDFNTVPSKIVVAYFDEDTLKAFIIQSQSKTYYLFKVDHQKENQLNIHQKYISSSLDFLMEDYEKHCKTKGKNNYEGVGDFSLIKDIDYFEDKYQKEIKEQISKESNIYRLIFHDNNLFTSDFVYLVEKKLVTITNPQDIDKKVLSLSTMEKNKHDRQDCLLINSETKDIEYFIFTYKPFFIKHYFLFKHLGNDEFEFIKESISFNSLFAKELKDLKYKNNSELASRSFAKIRYENFYLNYIEFEEEEELEEIIKNELSIEEIELQKAIAFKEALLKEVLLVISETSMPLDIGVTYHGRERIKERIGDMQEKEMLSLAKVAYEKGLTSAHFIEKDREMFKFLQYQQNKRIGKTLRLYNDILFFYSLEPPHALVTCFPYRNNYEMYTKKEKR